MQKLHNCTAHDTSTYVRMYKNVMYKWCREREREREHKVHSRKPRKRHVHNNIIH